MARSSKFQWSGCGARVPDERIRTVERAFGVGFPDSFLAMVRECDGGYPGDLCFKVRHPGDDGEITEWSYGFGRLLSFREPMPREVRQRMLTEPDAWREVTDNPWSSIEEYAEDLPHGMQAGLVPFAEMGEEIISASTIAARRAIGIPLSASGSTNSRTTILSCGSPTISIISCRYSVPASQQSSSGRSIT